MAAVEEPVAIDGEKLEQFVFRAVDEVGATLNSALVVMGDKLGLYKALAGAGPLTPMELARRTGVAERYVQEWLNAQAAGGYVEYDPESGRYTLPPEQAMALTDEDSPFYVWLMIRVIEFNVQLDNVPLTVMFDHRLPVRTVAVHVA